MQLTANDFIKDDIKKQMIENVREAVVTTLMDRFLDWHLSEIEISEREANSIADEIIQRLGIKINA